MKELINIAVDGHSSCGKSTLARDLAQKIGYKYIDSGAMYRAITLFSIKHIIKNDQLIIDDLLDSLHQIKIDFHVNSSEGTNEVLLNGVNVEQNIRTPEITAWVSEVATIPEVREKLVAIQKLIGLEKGVVMDGRDIGTVVLPDAELKIFVTADIDVRAMRRWKELGERGIHVHIEDVRENLLKRDHIDSTRENSPLVRAKDAKLLDTSELSPQEQVATAFEWFEETISEKSS